MFDRDTAEAELHSILAEDPEIATFATVEYTCNKASVRRQELEQRLQDSIEQYTFTLSFQASDFTTEPVRGQEITYDSTIYRILATSHSPDGVELRLDLGSQYSKGK